MQSPFINPDSLSLTLDNVNDQLLAGNPLPQADATAVALWIAGRQGLPHSYAGMFAPTDQDFRDGVKLFTGERLHSGASLSHILGEEACRILLLLKSNNPQVETALQRATNGMLSAIERSREKGYAANGMYCCGTCTPAYWRHLAVGGLVDGEREIETGLMTLKKHRLEEGGWRRFPFHWTVAALVEIGTPAKEELRIVGKRLERMAGKATTSDVYSIRRALVARKALVLL